MKRLGYTKFVAQGGDWGAIVTEQMGVQAPPELLGIHTNMPDAIPADIDKAAFVGCAGAADLSADEKVAYERLQFVYQKGIGYGFQMGCARRRCTASRIRRSAWRPISSTTTQRSYAADRPRLRTGRPTASRETTSSTTSRSPG